MTLSQKEIRELLEKTNTVAIVGVSRNPAKASYQVAEYLQKQGYNIILINPTANEILGEKVYKSLLDIPLEMQRTIQIVDVFRPSEEAPAIVDDAIKLKKQHGTLLAIWMQLGIKSNQAAEKAKRAELKVVMNKCLKIEHGRLFEEDQTELERIKARKIREMIKRAKEKEGTSTPVEVTDVNFDETVRRSVLTVVDCWAAWCAPCRMMNPIIKELAEEYAGKILFGKLNVDENPKTATQYNVMGIPTLLIMKDGVEVDRMVGVAPKSSIHEKLKKYM